MTSTLPPQAELARVVAGLVAHLPTRYATLLADERWAAARDSIDRLAVPGAAAAVAAGLGDAESARFADVLRERWSALGDVDVPPAAAIVPADGTLEVVVAGLEDGWTATWHGPVEPLDGAQVRAAPASGGARVSVRVFGRSDRGRIILATDLTVPEQERGDGAPD